MGLLLGFYVYVPEAAVRTLSKKNHHNLEIFQVEIYLVLMASRAAQQHTPGGLKAVCLVADRALQPAAQGNTSLGKAQQLRYTVSTKSIIFFKILVKV